MTEGSAIRRLLGLLGVTVGAVLPPLAGNASAVYCHDCSVPRAERGCCQLTIVLPMLTLWSPRVDPRQPGEEATCLPPLEQGGGRILEDAPKPPGYDPFAPPDPLHACMLVDPAGHVQAVRLSAGFGRERDRILEETIAAWRFTPSPSASDWVRVRLTTRYGVPAAVP